MKKVLILLFLLLPMMATAYSFSDGTFAYNINNDKQTVIVVANTNAYSGDLVIPATVTNEGQTYQVTEVGASAFKNCTRLYSIQFPEGLKIIGNNAFVGCTGLENVKLPNSLEQINYAAFKGCRLLEQVDLGTGIKAIYGNYDGSTGSGAFEDCTNLVTISIPASVTEINASVFRGCTALESVTLHDGVEHIGSHCFQNCSSLTSIVIPSSVTNIGENTFVGCRSLENAVLGSGLAKLGDEIFSGCQALEHVTINNGCAYIPAKTFQNCTGLTEISIPGSVESIGYAAFKGCRSLERVTLEQGLVSIYGNYDGSTGSGAFEDCISLENIVIPNSVTEMNASTFRGCTNLKSITMSKSLLHIGSHCFQNCKSLISIIIPSNASSLGAHMFSGCTSLQTAVLGKGITKMGESLFKGCSALKEVTIEKGCGIIAAMTFENCTSLTSISIPGSVESVGYSSFKGCTSLSSVHIEKGLTALYGNYNGSTGSGAFENCTALEEVVLPSSLTTINASVFRNCSSLKRFTIQATVLPETGTNVFQKASIAEATLYVPEKSIEKYRSTEPWSQFGVIKALEEAEQPTGYPTTSYELSADGKTLISWKGSETVIDMTSDPVFNGVTSIGYRAFFRNTTVQSIKLAANITNIDYDAFFGLSSLVTVSLPASLLDIKDDNFVNCQKLTNFDVVADNPVYSTSDGVLFCKSDSGLRLVVCGGGKAGEYTVPDQVNIIGYDAFYFCNGLTRVVLGKNVRQIMLQGFYNCSNLKEVVFPEGLTDIGDYAFTDCVSLSHVVLPSSISTIGRGTFLRCNRLMSLTCLNPEPPETHSSAFQDTPLAHVTLRVPKQSVTLYQQTYPWNQFGIIEAIDGTSDGEQAWFMITNDSREIPMQQVSMIVAADDDATFAVLDADGNILADLVKRARFVQKSATSIDIPMANEQNMLKSFVNNRLTLIGAKQDIYIYSVSGVQVQHAHPTGVETTVDVSRLTTGTYIVKCGQQSFKFKKK